MADSQSFDPFRSFKFRVSVAGAGPTTEIGFQKVSGLKESSDVVEYREGNTPIHKRKLPGLTNYDPISLTRGGTNTNFLFEWRMFVASYGSNGYNPSAYDGKKTGADGMGFRSTVTIKLFDKGYTYDEAAVRQWRINLAWPSELSVSDLNAEASEVLIESLVLQHEGLEVITGSAGGSSKPSNSKPLL